MQHVLFPPIFREQAQSLLLPPQKEEVVASVFSHAIIRIMFITLILMFSSNLARNQGFISSTAAVKDTSQSSSLQHNKRSHPELASLSSSSLLHNCFWIFISFKLEANNTSKNTPMAPGRNKTDKLL